MIAVVIPCYRVRPHILDVIAAIGSEVSRIYVIDDCCPEGSGQLVQEKCTDSRIHIIWHPENRGVGGALKSGYRQAIEDGMNIIVKIDGDGQMDPKLIPLFIRPILAGEVDYSKGNRFYDLEKIRSMPTIRIFGNAALSMVAKFSTGYWNIFDITNGYTAIHTKVLKKIPLSKISDRYFFETDMLFRLNTIRASAIDIPMDAVYGNEKSNLKISSILVDFISKHLKNSFKRIFYNYFLRDMTIASLELILGVALLGFGICYGLFHWIQAVATSSTTPPGTVMLAALPTIVGLQMLLAFVTFDVSNVPSRAIHPNL